MSTVTAPNPALSIHQDNVLAPVAAWSPSGTAHAEVYLAPTLIELFGDLAARLGRADDEHRAGRQRRWIAVLAGVKLLDLRWQVGAEGWDLGLLEEACGDHDIGRLNGSLVGVHQVASPVLFQPSSPGHRIGLAS